MHEFQYIRAQLLQAQVALYERQTRIANDCIQRAFDALGRLEEQASEVLERFDHEDVDPAAEPQAEPCKEPPGDEPRQETGGENRQLAGSAAAAAPTASMANPFRPGRSPR
jgi:hypothetical protein